MQTFFTARPAGLYARICHVLLQFVRVCFCCIRLSFVNVMLLKLGRSSLKQNIFFFCRVGRKTLIHSSKLLGLPLSLFFSYQLYFFSFKLSVYFYLSNYLPRPISYNIIVITLGFRPTVHLLQNGEHRQYTKMTKVIIENNNCPIRQQAAPFPRILSPFAAANARFCRGSWTTCMGRAAEQCIAPVAEECKQSFEGTLQLADTCPVTFPWEIRTPSSTSFLGEHQSIHLKTDSRSVLPCLTHVTQRADRQTDRQTMLCALSVQQQAAMRHTTTILVLQPTDQMAKRLQNDLFGVEWDVNIHIMPHLSRRGDDVAHILKRGHGGPYMRIPCQNIIFPSVIQLRVPRAVLAPSTWGAVRGQLGLRSGSVTGKKLCRSYVQNVQFFRHKTNTLNHQIFNFIPDVQLHSCQQFHLGEGQGKGPA